MRLVHLITLCTPLISYAAPLNRIAKRAGSPSDLQVLQYALTLENLESAFYKQALDKFSASDFANAGYPDWVRGRVSQISAHESSHVKLLSAALGNNSVPACQYSFPVDDPASFINFASGLENIGVSAYIGANRFIADPMYRSVAGSILAVEARHQGFLNGPVLHNNDWTGPYDAPLGLDMVYTLASQLITSCPSDAPTLPVAAQSPLLSAGKPIFNAVAGSKVPLTYMKSSSSVAGPIKAVIYNGLGSQMIDYVDGQITLPASVQGWSFLILTNAADISSVTSANTVAGPAQINTFFGASQGNPGFMGVSDSTNTPPSDAPKVSSPVATQPSSTSTAAVTTTTSSAGNGGGSVPSPVITPGGGGAPPQFCAPNRCTTNDQCRRGSVGGFCNQGTRVNGMQCGRSCQ